MDADERERRIERLIELLYEAAFDGATHPPLRRQRPSVQAFYRRLALTAIEAV